MARTLTLGNVIALINGNRVVNISATAPVLWTQNGYNATISVPEATQAASGLMSSTDKTKLDGIQSNSVALGETSSTSYRGDRGKIAYDHSLIVTGNPHQVTKAEVGLSNVPNVATNDQTPTYTTASSLSAMTSGEVLSTAFGKLSKVTDTVISHTADTTIHITSAERGAWNNKVDKVSGKALSTNDFNNDYKTKLDGIEAGAEVNEIYAKDHGLAAGAIVVLSREIEELRKYCSELERLVKTNVDCTYGIVKGYRGFGYCDDPSTPKNEEVHIWVDPALQGSKLYIQLICNPYSEDYRATAPWIFSTELNEYKVQEGGHGVTAGQLLCTPFSKCYYYVTTVGYVWNATISQSRSIAANTGAFGIDGFPVNGVDFEIRYCKANRNYGQSNDPEEIPSKSRMNESVLGYYDVLAMNGYAPTYTKYANLAAAIAGFNNGETVVIDDCWSLDYLLQNSLWKGNRYIRLTSVPPLSVYSGDYYREIIAPAV